jgi:AcrR family transcriptional regulator
MWDHALVSDEPAELSTRERILDATVEVLARFGEHKLSLSDVASAARVSRQTLYNWFPTKQDLLDASWRHEQQKYDAGLARAIAGLEGQDRLDAVLRFMVESRSTYSLTRMLHIEPDHVLHQLNRLLPVMRDRLLEHFPGPDGPIVASLVTRVAFSHVLLPGDDADDRYYAELRLAAGLGPVPRTAAHRNGRPSTSGAKRPRS